MDAEAPPLLDVPPPLPPAFEVPPLLAPAELDPPAFLVPPDEEPPPLPPSEVELQAAPERESVIASAVLSRLFIDISLKFWCTHAPPPPLGRFGQERG
jgi:hypothetical protein